ncbi:hypothetical protein IMZ11_37845 [Microtetraspora sp. AC03309]|uniref:DUF6461 domain-containing protein n=1 Tax=Microtetraspora sp. AC03309 TaxID=2779376 RepID=UPI001E4A7752|nr:DUF6461 domain-containing protein [Microtetraspora sp. AC03309]MCC5581382.1 hypothetical protein [Microtetraspora sp. AC03309]
MDAMQFEENVLEPYGLLPVFCGTWCSEPDVLEVARRLGADPSSAEPATWQLREEDTVLIGNFGAWTLALEEQLWRGNDRQTLGNLSSGGHQALNYWWDVNGVSSFMYAADGRLLVRFEPAMGLRAHWSGEDPQALTPYLNGLPLGEGTADDSQARLATFVLIRRLTGHILDKTWLDAEHQSFWLT